MLWVLSAPPPLHLRLHRADPNFFSGALRRELAGDEVDLETGEPPLAAGTADNVPAGTAERLSHLIL